MAATVEAQNDNAMLTGFGQGLENANKDEDGTDVNLLKSYTSSGASYSTAISGDTAESRPTPASRSSADNGIQCNSRDIFPLFGDDADPRLTKLDYLASYVPNFETVSISPAVVQGRFTFVSPLAGTCSGVGVVELYEQQQQQQQPADHQYNNIADKFVVVKRVPKTWVYVNQDKEACEYALHYGQGNRESEDNLNEIGVYCLLFREQGLGASGQVPLYLLKMHDIFQAGPDVWLVLEHGQDGDLFHEIKSSSTARAPGGGRGPGIPMDRIMTWSWQLLQAVAYLHSRGIGHRDISAENILLRDNDLRLMDFGQAVLTIVPATGEPFRYFRGGGKPYYRGPECYVPLQSFVEVEVPPGSRGGDIVFVKTPDKDFCEFRLPADVAEGQRCLAEPWGYAATFADVFACGALLYILATGMPPWKKATLRDPHFQWASERGAVTLANVQLQRACRPELPDELAELMASMLACNPSLRPGAQQCLGYSFYGTFEHAPIACHFPEPQQQKQRLSKTSAGVAEPWGAAEPADAAQAWGAAQPWDASQTWGAESASGMSEGKSLKGKGARGGARGGGYGKGKGKGKGKGERGQKGGGCSGERLTSSSRFGGRPSSGPVWAQSSQAPPSWSASTGDADAASPQETRKHEHSGNLPQPKVASSSPSIVLGAPAHAARRKMPEARKQEARKTDSSNVTHLKKSKQTMRPGPMSPSSSREKVERQKADADDGDDLLVKKMPVRKFRVASDNEEDEEELARALAATRKKPSLLVDKLSLSLLPPPPPLWRHGVTGKD